MGYKLTLKPVLSQGTQFLLGADAGIGVYIVLLIYQKGRNSLQKLLQPPVSRDKSSRVAGNLLILLTVLGLTCPELN